MNLEKAQSGQTPNLYQRLVNAYKECENLRKTGKHAHGWGYVEEDAIVEQGRELLGKHGIALLPHVVSRERVPFEAGAKTFERVNISMRFVLFNADNPEEREVFEAWPGVGTDMTDNGDAGLKKAITCAKRTFIEQLFNMSAEPKNENENETGNNRERDRDRGRQNSTPKPQASQPKPASPPPPEPPPPVDQKSAPASQVEEPKAKGYLAKIKDFMGWVNNSGGKFTAISEADQARIKEKKGALADEEYEVFLTACRHNLISHVLGLCEDFLASGCTPPRESKALFDKILKEKEKISIADAELGNLAAQLWTTACRNAT